MNGLRKAEHDFLSWTSFPSSIKYVNDEPDELWVPFLVKGIPVTAGKMLKLEFNAKKQDLIGDSLVAPYAYKAGGVIVWPPVLPGAYIGTGSLNWEKYFTTPTTIPAGIVEIAVVVRAGWGTKEIPGITWLDDLKIYQDDVLIYSDDFSNWNPIIGVGVGAPIGGVAGYLLKEPLGPMVSEVVGAVLGGALGGGVGLLTGLGIIPVPQIPALGAVPEGPVAPARLGKYQITG